MFLDEETFMLPLFGLWRHTADALPPSGAAVLGYNLVTTGGCQVMLLHCEYDVDEDGDIDSEPLWYPCFRELTGAENSPIPAPIAWCEVQWNFPSAPLGQCDDCGGYFKGEDNPCGLGEDEDD